MNYYSFLIALLFCFTANAQTPGEWTWMTGSDVASGPVFGVQGVPANGNTPGNSYEARPWVDQQGNFWLYGGLDLFNFLNYNDLWRYNPTTNQWTWMKGNGLVAQIAVLGVQGVAAPANNPGACYLGNSASWVDLSGNLWLLEANESSSFCIMWRYSIATNQWTWVHGNIPPNYGTQGVSSPLNNPQSFYEAPISWVDADGDLWLHDGYNGGVMWEYDIATNQWTWMNGTPNDVSLGIFSPASYGPQGVFNATNQPGSSWIYADWKSLDGTFYMFGPNDFSIGNQTSVMWQFDPLINQWAWVGGSIIPNQTSSFGAPCTFSPSNIPSTNLEFTATWTDLCGKFWGYNESEGYLWCYDPDIDQFALIEGDLVTSDAVLGTIGVSSPANHPGQTYGPPSWTDLDGNMWKLGTTVAGVGNSALMRYAIDPTCVPSSGNMNVTANPLSGCTALNVAFTPSVVSGAIDYEWDFGVSGITTDTSSLANPSFTYTSAGTYTAQLIVSGNIGCGATNDTVTVNITVTDPPTVTVNDATICAGSAVALTANGATTYSWTPAGGLNTTVGPTVQASPAVTTTYIVTGTSAGCSSTDTAVVTVNALPTITVNSPTICPEGSATLTANGGDTYSWTPAATLSASTGSPVTATPSVNTVYTVTGTDTSTLCSNTAQATVTVEIPQITVNSDTNCLGDPADVSTLTATGASTYVWSPSTGLSTTTGATVTASPTQTTVYTVIGTTAGGCLDTTTATVTAIPDFTLTVNSDSICTGQSVLLTANGATTYSWSPATGLSATTGTEVVASPTTTTVYTVTGTTAGCSETTISTVTVFPQPTASIFASPNPTSTVESTVNIQTSSNNNSNSTNWYLDDSLISQLNSFAYTFPSEPGSYVVQLIVTNALGCSDTGYVTIVVQEDIIFYVPNSFTPNDDDFNGVFIPIITSGIDTKDYAFSIFNRWGELVFEAKEISEGWDGTYKGVRCQDGTYTWSLKFKSKYNDGVFEHNGHVTLVR